MKGKTLKTVTAFVLMAGLSQYAMAVGFDSIQHNLIDGINDTTYDGSTGRLAASSNSTALTLNDNGGILHPNGPTVVTNVQANIETFFHSQLSPATAKFTGGSLLLSFDFDPDGAGPSPVGSYSIGGPITAMEFTVNIVTPTFSTIDGEGLWNATTVNLPGSGQWLDGGGFSSIKSLTLAFGIDLTGFDWSSPTAVAGGTVGPGILESQYALTPDQTAVPEPASIMLLLACATGTLIRRRSA